MSVLESKALCSSKLGKLSCSLLCFVLSYVLSGGLGMGVTIDKSRGNTIAECVSIKTVTEGGAAALATSPRGVGLKLGKIHLKKWRT